MPKTRFRHLISPALLLYLALTGTALAVEHTPSPADALAALPTTFVPNHGQADPGVRFEARGLEGRAFFTENELVLALPSDVLRLSFTEADPGAELAAGERLPGIHNAYLGNDPSRWASGVPTYGGVVYRQLWPGIDLAYEGRGGTLKGTYRVAPGIDPGTIRWRWQGAAGLEIDPASGDLHIALASGASMVEEAPIAWQEIGGERRPVEVRFALQKNGELGFELGAYANDHPLIIDPTLVYSTYVGGTWGDEAYGVAVDHQGMVYVTGRTYSQNFPTAQPFQSFPANTSAEAFLFKLDPQSNTLVYSTYLGGSDWETGQAVAVDWNGDAYVTGETDSHDFPVTGHLQPFHAGGFLDAYVTKFDAGGGLVFSTYLGGGNSDFGSAIAVDPLTGEVVVFGDTNSPGFPIVDAWQSSLAGGSTDFFLTWLEPDGNGIVRSTFFGGSNSEWAMDLAVDLQGGAVAVGTTMSFDVPMVNAAYPSYHGTSQALKDGVVVKFDAGGGVIYSSHIGGDGHEQAEAVAVDPQGHAFVTGVTNSTNFPLVGNPVQNAPQGGDDAFVIRFDDSGQVVYSTYLGGNEREHGLGIAVDDSSNAYVVGVTHSGNLPQVGAIQAGSNFPDAFLTVLDASGSSHLFSTYLGGNGLDIAFDVAVLGDVAHVAGQTGSTDLPLAQPWQSVHQGASDVFVSIIETEAFRCRELSSPTAMPAPTVLDFDSLPNYQVLGTSLQASHGVIFEDSAFTQAQVLGNNPWKSYSAPNRAINDAVYPYTSANRPMTVEFASPKTRIGMWIGNGGIPGMTAVLTAYDTWGSVICQSVKQGIPEQHTLFVGLHDPTGRIAYFELDYGAQASHESIDDLAFTP